jgi:hypothetical protein
MFKGLIMMKIAFIALFLTINSYALVKNDVQEHVRESKWDVSPDNLKFVSLFFAAEMITLGILSPDYVQPKTKTSDFDYNKDDISVPEWAYFLGNQGPTLMTIGIYGHYLFTDDELAFEKAYVLTESLLIAQGITFGAKYTFNKKRPDESNYLSFPSGHTTHAFTIGTWISMELYRSEKFYKNKLMASLPMLYSAYIGWTRVDAKKHTATDVLAGATIGTLTSYLLYDYHFNEKGEYRFESKISIIPSIDPMNETYGLNVRMPL